jgi:hypothetical protein
MINFPLWGREKIKIAGGVLAQNFAPLLLGRKWLRKKGQPSLSLSE